MTKQEYQDIKDRAEAIVKGPANGDVCVICCHKGTRESIHPDELGADQSLMFQQYVEAMAKAVQDRRALVAFIEENFEIDWSPS